MFYVQIESGVDGLPVNEKTLNVDSEDIQKISVICFSQISVHYAFCATFAVKWK